MQLIHKKVPITTETIKSKLLGVDEASPYLQRPQQQNKRTDW